jgi:RHH-type proline utilization regulon transcriptional repressor/proline dehydrogenase/delta 1-pyrroline-5-carboxylate dehydrogenase
VDSHGNAIPLIAETGGQNAMIVDSSALVEQVVGDIIASAFDSAGQRCSALRVLCVQEDAADRVVDMLRDAMSEYRVGDPGRLEVDIGPVIDAEAQANIEKHVEFMRAKGRRVYRPAGAVPSGGTFVSPTLIEIDSITDLQREVFGPVLHVVRYERPALREVVEAINATGYGLTMGVHTRIEETIAQVVDQARVGNVYVNRNVVGAVVGVQPFGGEGLSGTGPKAGGPLYLLRLLARSPAGAARAAILRDDALASATVSSTESAAEPTGPLAALRDWALAHGQSQLANACASMHQHSPSGLTRVLPGPTGERNVYSTVARDRVLCLAAEPDDLLAQLAATCAVGAMAVWPVEAHDLLGRLPPGLRVHVNLVEDWKNPGVPYDAVLHTGDAAGLLDVSATLARRPGPIVSVTSIKPGAYESVALERLVIERSLSLNTAAAGGNASLMTIG